MNTIIIILTISLVACIAAMIVMLATSRRRNDAAYEEQLNEMRLRLEQQAAMLRQQSALEFRTLAEDILLKRERDLTSENSRQISELLNPLRGNIEDFRKAVRDYYVNDNKEKAVLNSQIEALMASNREIGEEARRLSNALSSNSSVQGRWGETVLETLLSRAGMVKGVNFLTQSGSDESGRYHDEDERGLRPDVIVMLPDDHRIVIDAKVSLTAFMEYHRAEGKSAETEALRRHTDSVKKHVDELARKQYHKNIKGAMEHTLMFIPNDPAYIAAVSTDPGIWDYAYSRNVVIVSSTHLLSVMQIIRQLWRVEKQNSNAEEIARLGGIVFDKMVSLFDDLKEIEKAIANTTKAYNKCVAHIEHPTVGLKARSARLRDLGSKTTKNLK